MYTDMGERALLAWQLDYTMSWVIGAFEAIPEDALCRRPRANINAPGWIFGHIAVTERLHVGGFLEAVHDIPDGFDVFRAPHPAEQDIRRAIDSADALIDYWRAVRRKTRAYLDRITDADLKQVPARSLLRDDDPNRQNPIREWFVMTIKHQNQHWGQLEIIARLLAAT
jgi:uncharacterized damage-inducible protein DinB